MNLNQAKKLHLILSYEHGMKYQTYNQGSTEVFQMYSLRIYMGVLCTASVKSMLIHTSHHLPEFQ